MDSEVGEKKQWGLSCTGASPARIRIALCAVFSPRLVPVKRIFQLDKRRAMIPTNEPLSRLVPEISYLAPWTLCARAAKNCPSSTQMARAFGWMAPRLLPDTDTA